MESRPLVSFCATDYNTVDRISGSIESIEDLGRELHASFEIVVAEGPSDDGSTERLLKLAETQPNLHIVRHTERNRGFGRRTAFENSRGSIIVPFDTSVRYDSAYGRLLSRYIKLGDSRMLFSEICAIPRSAIERVGGWRDLIGGEDIDLYARVIVQSGLLAFPTERRSSQSERMSSFARQMRYVRGSAFRKLQRMYAVQRDQIIGANYRVQDLMWFNQRKHWSERQLLRLFFTAAYLGSRRSSIRPFVADRNNYLIVREALLRSLDRGDYKEVGLDEFQPKLLLTQDEIAYLARASSVWQQLPRAVERYVAVK